MLILKYGQYLSRNALNKLVTPAAASRSYCDFAHRWMPGPYPKTKEEHDAAAKKYNLIPEDYVPSHPDSGMGDYPYIHRLSHQEAARPYWIDYDEPFNRRNYGEPLAEYYVSQQFEPPNVVVEHQNYIGAGLFAFVLLIIYAILGPEYAVNESKPKQFPHQYFPGTRPKKHYTFESND